LKILLIFGKIFEGYRVGKKKKYAWELCGLLRW